MSDGKIVVQEVIRVGTIPDNMIYWSSASRDVWGQFANTAVTTNSWEIEVNFND